MLEGEKSPDDRIKAFLRQCKSLNCKADSVNNQEGVVQSKNDGTPPDLKGFLSKWTNYKSGWRTRWFVLENGMLSYCKCAQEFADADRQREDEPVACRGSIAMAVAVVTPSSDNSRFELHSKVSSSMPKIIVKSAHRGEIARWVHSIRLNIEYYSSPDRQRTKKRQGSGDVASTLSAMPPADGFLHPGLIRSTTGLSRGSIADLPAMSPTRLQVDDDNVSIFDMADDRSIVESNDAGMPHETTFDLGILHIKTQLELTDQLVASLYTGPSSENGAAMQRTPSRQQAIKDALRSSLATLATQISQQKLMTQDRERYLLGRIDREIEARRLWEENMLTVAKQQAETDRQLTEAARQNDKKRRALKQARGVIEEMAASPLMSPDTETPPSGPKEPPSAVTDTSFTTARTRRQSMSISNIHEVHAALAEADSDEDEDEFFDAIETGIPNMQQHEAIANPDKDRPGTPAALDKFDLPVKGDKGIKGYLARKSLEPYNLVRNKLPIEDDKRPSVSRESPAWPC